MPQILHSDQIRQVLKNIDVIKTIEEGFVAYSQGKVVVPPVGEMIFENPPGDVHIKYGYIKEDDYYVVKIASGFYENAKLGLPPNNGLMLIFRQKSGELISILLDQGYLTDVRTAAAGAVTAKYLAPKNVHTIGIIGTGIQAKMQLEYLQPVTNCRDVIVSGRNEDHLRQYKQTMEPLGFSIRTTRNPSEVTGNCNLIVTTTPAKTPLLLAGDIRPGSHITAMGSDTPAKNELAPDILKNADKVVADSISQCSERGEIHHALKAGYVRLENILELGNIISGRKPGRENDEQITIADLTGVAVQDIGIAKAVYEASRETYSPN